ncbi:hypothetical protein [Paramicrobacterium humi]|uniref:hypothetical protein n=1 Tax=Paramicrobacterium humi TaxID=640635 RepID=UPI000B80E80D|nr:hypothetical protein [Microbacterium humi]
MIDDGDGDEEVVTELTLNDRGVWRVWTHGSSHILNLDEATVTRVPGKGRSRSINDITRPLRSLDACRVGERGRWSMSSDDVMVDFYWHVSSTIRKIEREAPHGPSAEHG